MRGRFSEECLAKKRLAEKAICIIVFIATRLSVLYGQYGETGIWDIDRCISHALSGNPAVAKAELGIKISQGNLISEISGFLPSFSVSYESMPFLKTYTGDEYLSIDASLPLFQGGSRIAGIALARNDITIKKAGKKETENGIAIDIIRSFMQVILSVKLEETCMESAKRIRLQYEKTQKLVSAGMLASAELIDMEAEMASAAAELVRASNNIRNSERELNYLMNNMDRDRLHAESLLIPAREELFRLKPLHSEYSGSMSENGTVKGIISSLPEIAAAKAVIEKRKTEYRAAIGNILPKVRISASYRLLPHVPDRQDRLGISLAVNIPIFNSMQNSMAIFNAEKRIKEAEYDYGILEKSRIVEMEKMIDEAAYYYSVYIASGNRYRRAEESMRSAEKRFDMGIINANDYISAHSSMQSAVSEYLADAVQYLFHIKVIEYYIRNCKFAKKKGKYE